MVCVFSWNCRFVLRNGVLVIVFKHNNHVIEGHWKYLSFQLSLVVFKIGFKFSLPAGLHQSDRPPRHFWIKSVSLTCHSTVCSDTILVILVSKC